MRAKILATGRYLPDKVVPNNELNFPSASLTLIEKKTGVRERRFASEDQATSDLAALAAQDCLATAQIDANDIDTLIVATSSPDRIQPPTAARVQFLLQAFRSYAFDINAVCSGGIYALHVADTMIRSGTSRKILVIGAEVYSRLLNPNDFTTYPYFGDGAGAMLITETPDEDPGIIHTLLKTDGSKSDMIQIQAGGTMLPLGRVNNINDFYFRMNGREVYKFAVTKGAEIVEELLDVTKTHKQAIKYIIPHQANINIIKELSSRLSVDISRFIINIETLGNTAAASVLIGLDQLVKSRASRPGDLVVLVTFGGGLSWGASLIKL